MIVLAKQIAQRMDIPLPKKIDVECATPCPDITISHSYNLAKMREFDIELDAKVPKILSILPQIQTETLSSVKTRDGSRIYVEVSGEPSYISLEQVKNLSTKTVFVDDLDDVKIQKLSNEDIVMLKRSKK